MPRFVLVPSNARWADGAREALALGSLDCTAAESPAEAAAQAVAGGTVAVIVDAGHASFEGVFAAVREEKGAEGVALLAVVRDPMRDAADLERAFRLGAADYVAAGLIHHIRHRAAALAQGDPWAGVRAPAGRAVIADGNRARRAALGRILHQWGFHLAFAESEADMDAQIRAGQQPRIVLADVDLPPDGALAALGRLRAARHGAGTPCLVLIDPARIAAARTAVKDLAPAAIYDRSGPPENVIFAVNDLVQPRGRDMRRSPRLLYGAPVSFSVDAASEPIWAYTYNVNLSGLYVRTLVPPPLNTVLHVEFRPPFGEGFVAMEAQVMWRRAPGSDPSLMYPPGMGVRFVRRPLADEAGFCAGYAEMLREAGLLDVPADAADRPT